MFSLNLIFAAIIYLNITIVSSLKTLLTETVLEKVGDFDLSYSMTPI